MAELLVFTNATAIWLGRARRVVGPLADYERLPWFDGKRDHNGSVPHLASAINAPPFTDHQAWLEPGVHLHWNLPAGLTRGATRRSAVRPVQVGDLWFPPAPNRWLVLRRNLATDEIQRAWLVESDYVHPPGPRPAGVIAYPRQTHGPGVAPYLYVGRQIELDPGTMVPLDRAYSRIGPETSLGHHGLGLTALGPGDPLFAAYYPGCRSVFGLHDDKPPLGNSVRYNVYGWFSEGIVEPLANMVAALRTNPATALSLLAIAAKKNNATSPDPDPAKLTGAQWNEALQLALGQEFGWRTYDTNLPEGFDFPMNLVCVGGTRITPGTETPAPTAPAARPIGIGSSAAEAVAAWLMGDASLKPSEEDRLVQALAGSDLTNHALDLGPKLAEARHTEQFRAYRGHTIWMIRPSEANGAKPDEDASLSLPDELAHELNVLNALQEEYDRAHDAIAALRQELFADWHHYMTTAYPEGDSDPLALDEEAVRHLVEHTRLEPLEALQSRTGHLFRALDSAGNVVLADQHPTTVTGPAPYGPLVGGPAGTEFADAVPAGKPLAGFEIWSGAIIDDVGLLGATTRRPTGGNQRIQLAAGEHVTAIFGESGTWLSYDLVSKLGFETNLGRCFGPWGGWDSEVRTPFRLEAPDGMVIVGLRGRRETYLNAIGILVAPVSHLDAPAKDPGGTLARAVVDQYRIVQTLLDEMGQTLAIGPVPGPRYWRPNDPVIVLDDPVAAVSPRIDGSKQPDGLLRCFALSLSPLGWENSGDAFAGAARAPLGNNALAWHLSEHLIPQPSSEGENWHALQLEWEVEIQPLVEGGNIGTGRFAPDFITASQDLPAASEDLAAKKGLERTRTWQYLAGRSILNPAAWRILSERREEIPKDIADKLAKPPGALMVLPLGGFHDQLLMQRQEPQLGIVDPIGLPGQRSLTGRAREAVGNLHPTSPLPGNPFHPIRSGDLVVERLRVIDIFGRTKTWQPNSVRTARFMRPENTAQTDRAVLPLRFAQAARLNFRWLSAAHEDIESNAHPATSPVCGWLLPNDLDGEVAVYGRTGHLLGSVAAGGIWEPAPGDAVAPRSWREIPDVPLRRVVRWMTLPSNSDAIGSFLEMLDAALEQIDPKDAAQHQARALLIGRPIAVVRARLDFALQHHAALDQSANALRARIAGGEDDSHGIGAVEVPVRLGEHDQLNDGLCGYWIEEGAVFRDETFYTPHGVNPGTPHDRIRALGDEPLGEFPIRLTAGGPAQTVTMLVDPRGVVHATCGVLPAKSIAIPPDQYARQAAELRVTFQTAPILTAPDDVALPLPSEPGYSWSWIEASADGSWQETPHHPTVRQTDLVAGFGANGSALWDRLVEQGRIVPLDRHDAGVLMPGDRNAPANRFDDLKLNPEAVERGLHDIARSIGEAGIAASYGPRAVARDGWLQLRAAPLPVNSQKDAASRPGPGDGP
ncbi:MAG: jacalin-like lectin [Aestuariivirga sp.]